MIHPSVNLHNLLETGLPAWAFAGLEVLAVIASIIYWVRALLCLGGRLILPEDEDLAEDEDDVHCVSGKVLFILLIGTAVGFSAFLVMLHQLSCGGVVAC